MNSYFSHDTIVAIATSLATDSGVGIIRLSGPSAQSCVQTIIKESFKNPKPRFLHRVHICHPKSGELLDDGLAVFFPAGSSFTGEDVVELQLHGSRFLLQTILKFIVASGHARLALPGEFLFRASRNGKISVSEAQSIGQLISAKSMFEVQAIRRNFSSQRLAQVDELGKSIRNLLAQVELSIDFVDQDVEVISSSVLKVRLNELIEKTMALLSELKIVQRIAKGIQITLVGLPNAGKSTLFNALLSEERAIVSETPGTTRDVITEEFELGRYRVRLADTAGLRSAEGFIEKQGIERAKELSTESDLILVVIDAKTALLQETLASLTTKDQPKVIALNKWDLLSEAERAALTKQIADWKDKTVFLSASTGEGVDNLYKVIAEFLDRTFSPKLEHVFLPTEFQVQMLVRCNSVLRAALILAETTGTSNPELLSVELQTAATALSDFVGETTPETILTQIFSEFCIGK